MVTIILCSIAVIFSKLAVDEQNAVPFQKAASWPPKRARDRHLLQPRVIHAPPLNPTPGSLSSLLDSSNKLMGSTPLLCSNILIVK